MKNRRARLWARLKSRRGESLGEVLISVLISAVGLVMLGSMIVAATSMILISKDKMEAYYNEQANLALHISPDNPDGVTLTVRDGDTQIGTVQVLSYGAEGPNGARVVAYSIPQEEEPAPEETEPEPAPDEEGGDSP